MPGSPIPTSLEAITPEWLNAVCDFGAPVSAIELTDIGEGVGFMGVIARAELSYDDGAGTVDSVVVKLASPHEAAVAMALQYGFYEREVSFYRHLADEVPLRTARCHHAAMDPSSTPFVLVLEDLADARIADQLVGCTPADARLVVEAAAGLHAAYWESSSLATMGWLPPVNNEKYKTAQGSLAEAWPAFEAGYRDRVSASSFETARAMCTRLNEFQDRWAAEGPLTVAHYDMRLDNLLFDDEAQEVCFVDWQLMASHLGAFDLAYFIAWSMTDDDRRATQDELVGRYHAALERHGVEGYSRQQLEDDVRTSVIGVAMMAALGSVTVPPGNERGRRMLDTMVERVFAALDDFAAGEML